MLVCSRAHSHNIYGGPLSKVEMQEDTETQVSKLDVVLWYTLEVSRYFLFLCSTPSLQDMEIYSVAPSGQLTHWG